MWLGLHLSRNTCDIFRWALLAGRMHLRIVQPWRSTNSIADPNVLSKQYGGVLRLLHSYIAEERHDSFRVIREGIGWHFYLPKT